MYVPIESLGGRYEINEKGVVRNAKSHKRLKVLKIRGWQCVRVYYKAGKITTRSIAKMLQETHGVVKARKAKKTPNAIKVVVKKGEEKQECSSLRKAAEYIGGKEYYSAGYVLKKLKARAKKVYGWEIEYEE